MAARREVPLTLAARLAGVRTEATRLRATLLTRELRGASVDRGAQTEDLPSPPVDRADLRARSPSPHAGPPDERFAGRRMDDGGGGGTARKLSAVGAFLCSVRVLDTAYM